MSDIITNYVFIEEDDGEELKVKFTQQFCSCAGKCYPDILEVEDYPGCGWYHKLEIESPEICYFVKELLDKCNKTAAVV